MGCSFNRLTHDYLLKKSTVIHINTNQVTQKEYEYVNNSTKWILAPEVLHPQESFQLSSFSNLALILTQKHAIFEVMYDIREDLNITLKVWLKGFWSEFVCDSLDFMNSPKLLN